MNHNDLVEYLLDEGLVSLRDIVDGGLTVTDFSRRNRNFKVVMAGRSGYLVKQGSDARGRQTVAHEASVYDAFLHTSDIDERLSRYLPRYHGYDPATGTLVLGLVDDAHDLRQYHSRRRFSRMAVPQAMGRALASLHDLPADIRSPAPMTCADGPLAAKPWILSIGLPGEDLLEQSSAANLQLIRIVQQSPELRAALDELSRDYRCSSWIHGDVKWDNWILRSGDGRRRDVKLVDWEVSNVGDPAWDVGCALSDYLSHWLRSVPIVPDAPVGQLLDAARIPLRTLHPASRALWESYRLNLTSCDGIGRDHLLRSVRLAGARLLQTAFEELQYQPEITSTSVCMVQLSLNVMQRPDSAATNLFGLASGVRP